MMITRCLARRPATIQSAVGAWRRIPSRLSRSLYTVPTLDNHAELEQNGVKGLLSAKAFQIAYTDYQKYMVDELNVSTARMTPAIDRRGNDRG
ncbi:hypothetical protein A1F99_037550 [Pyrenophora tritici-repentis]|nr:hypothetical protein A1F99_037550 [Pyrenophora tritici-repentis]